MGRGGRCIGGMGGCMNGGGGIPPGGMVPEGAGGGRPAAIG